MNWIPHGTEKGNGAVPFRTWDGHMVIPVPSGGWRRARPLDVALMREAMRQLVFERGEES